MTQEKIRYQDKTKLFFYKYFEKNNLNILLTDSPEKEKILDSIGNELNTFGDGDLGILVGTMVNGLSREDKIWNQDKRDGILEVLPLVDLSKLDSHVLKNVYIMALTSQTKDSDPYGTISSLIEAGKILAPYFGHNEANGVEISEKFEKISSLFSDEERKYIKEGERDILNILKEKDIQEDVAFQFDDEKLGQRDRPSFEAPEEELHNEYLKTVKKMKTFKFKLWENTPEFRSLCKNYGINIEEFWNLNNPQDVQDALEKLKNDK